MPSCACFSQLPSLEHLLAFIRGIGVEGKQAVPMGEVASRLNRYDLGDSVFM